MIAYKAFKPGLVCRGYQFKMGLNVTDKANCKSNGFHCAENPLDCLSYYELKGTEFYIVEAEGDIDEDGDDSKISCTKLIIKKKLSTQKIFLHALAYLADHPYRKWSDNIQKDMARASSGYAVVRGPDPQACGQKGDYLALVQEKQAGKICQMALVEVDDVSVKPDTWYGVDLRPRTVNRT